MGWTGHKLPNEGWTLYTRGGTEGVYIQPAGSDDKIKLPAELLRMLVAADLRSHRVGELESMGDGAILGLPGAN